MSRIGRQPSFGWITLSTAVAAELRYKSSLKRVTSFHRVQKQGSDGLLGAPSRTFTTMFGERGPFWSYPTSGVFDFSDLCGRIATPDR
jgi:hypothetical protein